MARSGQAPAGIAFPPGFALVGVVNAIVRQKLSEARGRLVVNEFFLGAAWALVAGVSVVVVLRGLALAGHREVVFAVPWALALPLVVALALAVFRWRHLAAVAREVDVRAGTKDRFFTDLQASGETPWTAALHREVAAYAGNLKLGDHLKLPRPGRNFLWLAIPLLALLGLEGFHRLRMAGLAGELAGARKVLEEAQKAAASQKENPEVAEAAKEIAEALKALPDSGEPLREALRALAELERKLASAGGPDALSPAEAAALAGAVAEASPQLAGELQSGDHQRAADSVAKLDPAALAKALEQAAKHLESRKLRELARDRQAQQQLGAILRSTKGEGSGQGRKKFLSALRDIKQGNPGGREEGENPGGEGAPGEAPNGGEKPESSLADNTPPGGAPGSDKDLGKGADVGGENDALREAGGPEEFVAGQMADGASLVEMLRAAGGDDPAARRAWKSAYQAAAPAALDAVAREDVPSGSRLMVKRYFEAIRPKD